VNVIEVMNKNEFEINLLKTEISIESRVDNLFDFYLDMKHISVKLVKLIIGSTIFDNMNFTVLSFPN